MITTAAATTTPTALCANTVLSLAMTLEPEELEGVNPSSESFLWDIA